jgi:hypothetical protein
MPTFGPLVESPYQLPTPLERLPAIPVGDLVDSPYAVTTPPDTVPAPLANRFPTPPSAYGFLADKGWYETVLDGEVQQVGNLPYISALSPEPTHLEPTVGQIWPR